jgi:hypothetical protein
MNFWGRETCQDGSTGFLLDVRSFLRQQVSSKPQKPLEVAGFFKISKSSSGNRLL